MDPSSIDIIWLVIVLVVVNFILVAVNKSTERFWHPAVFLWLALLFITILFSVTMSDPVDKPLPGYNQEGPADAAVLNEWNATRQKEQTIQRKIFRLLAAQSFLSLFLLMLGYQQSATRMYRQSVFTFFLICLVMLALEILFLLGIL